MPKGRQPRGVTPRPRSGAAAGRSYPLSEFRVGGREEQPHSRGVVASQEQEGLEKLVHVHKKILAYNFLFWWCLCLVLESV